jgi:hypothetical protein
VSVVAERFTLAFATADRFIFPSVDLHFVSTVDESYRLLSVDAWYHVHCLLQTRLLLKYGVSRLRFIRSLGHFRQKRG